MTAGVRAQTLAVLVAMSQSQVFLVPLLLGILLAYTPNPLVVRLVAMGLPRALAAFVVMVIVIGAIGLGTFALRSQMRTIVEHLPEPATKLSAELERVQLSQGGDMRKMQSAATLVE